MKNIHILPTDKPSRLYTNNGTLHLDKYSRASNGITINQHIYITSDEEIKDGDSVILKSGRLTKAEIQEGVLGFQTIDGIAFLCFQEDDKKIILTTDQDLIGVQAIPDEFLEWFVKNPSCEWVETFIDTMGCTLENCDANPCINYKIIIPTEEPKTNLEKLPFPELVKEFAEYYKNIPLIEESKQETERERVCNCGLKESEHNVRHPFIPRLEPKQETLEEAAIRYEETDFNTTPTEETSQMMIQRAFINGAL